ncbi:MAG: hypothetical protein P8130_06055 [Deltaproteobacteria bacterium]
MNKAIPLAYPLSFSVLFLVGCIGTTLNMPINYQSIEPGGIVRQGDQKFKLLGFPLKLGDSLPDTPLVNASNLEDVRLAGLKGRVIILSIVPSIDTKVCERQTQSGDRSADR